MPTDDAPVTTSAPELPERFDMAGAMEALRQSRLQTPEQPGTPGVVTVKETVNDDGASELGDLGLIIGEEVSPSEGEDKPLTSSDGKTDSEDPVVFQLEDGTPVKKSEAQKGYLRQSQFTKITQETAERAKALAARETELNEYRAARDRYQTVLEEIDKELATKVVKLPDPALQYSDPDEYQRQTTNYFLYQEAVRLQKEESDRVKAEKEADEKKTYESYIRTQSELLLEKVPSLKKATTVEDRRKVMTVYRKTFETVGFDTKDFDKISDHRTVRLLDLATKGLHFEKIRAKNGSKAPSVTTTTAPIVHRPAPAPTMRPGPSGSPSGGDGTHPAESEFAAAKSRFDKSPTMENALSLRKAERALHSTRQARA